VVEGRNIVDPSEKENEFYCEIKFGRKAWKTGIFPGDCPKWNSFVELRDFKEKSDLKVRVACFTKKKKKIGSFSIEFSEIKELLHRQDWYFLYLKKTQVSECSVLVRLDYSMKQPDYPSNQSGIHEIHPATPGPTYSTPGPTAKSIFNYKTPSINRQNDNHPPIVTSEKDQAASPLPQRDVHSNLDEALKDENMDQSPKSIRNMFGMFSKHKATPSKEISNDNTSDLGSTTRTSFSEPPSSVLSHRSEYLEDGTKYIKVRQADLDKISEMVGSLKKNCADSSC